VPGDTPTGVLKYIDNAPVGTSQSFEVTKKSGSVADILSWIVPHHGNYMGPYWSEGKVQSSVANPSMAPVDYGDLQSMIHDQHYGRGDDLYKADMEYATAMIGQGENVWEKTHNTVAGVAVGAQGIARGIGILDTGAKKEVSVTVAAKPNVFQSIRNNAKAVNAKNTPF